MDTIQLNPMFHKMHHYLLSTRLKIIKPFGKNKEGHPFKISICDKNPDITQIFSEVFAKEERVEVVLGNILHKKADAIVSPANSFGDMGGGIDKAIDDFFEGEAQIAIQTRIRNAFFGEMPVGLATILETNSKQYPFIIAAPTMRVPGNVGKTIHAYLAMRGILAEMMRHNSYHAHKINHIVLPALCTGVGGMPYIESAEQMLAAIHNILDEGWKSIISPVQAPYPLGAKWALPEKLNKFRKKD